VRADRIVAPGYVSSGNRAGGWHTSREDLVMPGGVVTAIFLALCGLRFLRRRARWNARVALESRTDHDGGPLSVDDRALEPICLRADGAPGTLVEIGDDDEQFKLRARPNVVLLLEDGTRCTLVGGTLLVCSFPGFTLVRKATSRSSVAIAAGTPFFVRARRRAATPPPEAPHPFRGGAIPDDELFPVAGRYACNVEAPPLRRPAPKWIPRSSPSEKPRFRPWLYPGIPLAFCWLSWWQLEPPIAVLLFTFVFAPILLTGEDIAWRMSRE
jgi:hypothetical protein